MVAVFCSSKVVRQATKLYIVSRHRDGQGAAPSPSTLVLILKVSHFTF